MQPVGFLQAWARISTRDDREQIQQVARAGLEPGTTQPRFLLSYLDSNGPIMLVLALHCIVRVAFPALLLVVFAFPALLLVVFAFPALLLVMCLCICT